MKKGVFIAWFFWVQICWGQLRIEAEKFAVPEREVRAILEEVLAIFPAQKLPPLFVTHTEGRPMTLYEKNLRHETVIKLATRGRYWAQYIYQFAHELMHVRMQSGPGDRGNQWFEETLCETASLYALRQLSLRWREKAPFPSWRSYRHRLHEYAQKIIETREQIAPERLGAFYQTHRARLEASYRERSLNGAMAFALLPLFEEEPARWLALSTYSSEPHLHQISFAQRLQRWQDRSTPEQQVFIKKIQTLFNP